MASVQAHSPTGNPKEDISASEQFKIRLMPFEQHLLEVIANMDEEILPHSGSSESPDVPDSVLSKIFRQWGTAVAAEKALRTLTNDFEKVIANSNQFIVPELRQVACSAFFSILETPGDSNKCRAQSAKELNPHFTQNVLQRSDLLQYLQSIVVVFDQEQKRSWRIIIEMFKKYTKEMYRWVFETHHRFQYVYYEDPGFEIVHIVRMYYIRHIRPDAASTLLELFKTHNDDLGSRYWRRYQEEQAQIAERRSEFYGAFGLTKESVDSNSFQAFITDVQSPPDEAPDMIPGKEGIEVRKSFVCF